jgi:hypothetical protein
MRLVHEGVGLTCYTDILILLFIVWWTVSTQCSVNCWLRYVKLMIDNNTTCYLCFLAANVFSNCNICVRRVIFALNTCAQNDTHSKSMCYSSKAYDVVSTSQNYYWKVYMSYLMITRKTFVSKWTAVVVVRIHRDGGDVCVSRGNRYTLYTYKLLLRLIIWNFHIRSHTVH